MEFKEITAKTVDEAITKACLEFETSSDNLEFRLSRRVLPFLGIYRQQTCRDQSP